jgi:putative oxygen-independent coproporphyrinogen III oxidase
MNELSLYFHWPFCKSKCPYCDFNSHVRDQIDHETWLRGYLNEISKFRKDIEDKKINSIFFGGGTPSLMEPRVVAAILNELAKLSSFSDNIEITLEANPTSFEIEKFRQFREAGVNRISLGVQSLNKNDLEFLGREHSAKDARWAIESAADIFKNYSFDLIYARPDQTLKLWQKELENALELARDHISIYQLTIEKGTKFFSMYNKGEFSLPNDNISYDMYILSKDLLEQYGFNRYEVSNYAKNNRESIHNLCYWRYNDYLGLGPGAHSRLDDKAITQFYNPEKWLVGALGSELANQSTEQLSNSQMFNEILIMGLRLAEGIRFSKFEEKIENYEKYLNQQKLQSLFENDLIILDKKSFRATASGMLKINKIIEFLSV